MTEASYMMGGPRDGELIAIPGAPSHFYVAEPPDPQELFEKALRGEVDPYAITYREHTYELMGTFKLYRYKGCI